MKKLFILFLIFSFSISAQWTIEKSQSKDNMNSLLLAESDTKSTGLIITSNNFDGNLSLVYVANLALEKLESIKTFGDFSYGYSKEDNKFIAIKTIPNGIVTIENSEQAKLLEALESFSKSEMNLE